MTTLAVLIDATRATIEVVSLPAADLRSMRIALECDTVDVVQLGRTAPLDMWVDDEGLMKSPRRFFGAPWLHSPIATRGLVLGRDGPETRGLSEHEARAFSAFARSTVQFLEVQAETA